MSDVQMNSRLQPEAALSFLLGLRAEEALALFQTLPAPDPAAITGEYDGHIPYHIAEEWRAFVTDAHLGNWLGKGFRLAPAHPYDGNGYNRYLREGGLVNRMQFAWRLADSDIDGHPSLIMHYSAYPNWGGRNDLIDEIRHYAPGMLLGIYHTSEPIARFAPRAGEGGRSGIEFFVLTGPVGAPAREG